MVQEIGYGMIYFVIGSNGMLESMVVKYLTPSTLKKLPALLKEGIQSGQSQR